MALWDRVQMFLATTPAALEERSVVFETNALPLDEQIIALRRAREGVYRPWRVASIRQALGVPAIFGIVTTIANTVGTFSLEVFRNGRMLAPEERPRLTIRPNPLVTPGEFWTGSAYNIATRGEAWWYVAKRDTDDAALSLLNVPPAEVVVTEDPNDPLRPEIRWRGKKMRNEDMRQIVFAREPGELRGVGPLQMCGAAVSVAVEAQEWAANFYASGGHPSLLIKSAIPLSPDRDADGYNEADRLRLQWMDRPNNVPRVVDDAIEDVKEFGANPQGAQMMSSREFQVGEAARMFSYPMSLIGYAMAGSSLTYQNVGQELDKLTRTCLIPHFLEKFEQEMTDLLPRTMTCEFKTDRLLRADPKTRWEMYEIASRVIGQEDASDLARRSESLVPGNIETAPVPQAPPQAIPVLPMAERSLRWLMCPGCGKKAGRVGGPAEIVCSRCGQMVTAA